MGKRFKDGFWGKFDRKPTRNLIGIQWEPINHKKTHWKSMRTPRPSKIQMKTSERSIKIHKTHFQIHRELHVKPKPCSNFLVFSMRNPRKHMRTHQKFHETRQEQGTPLGGHLLVERKKLKLKRGVRDRFLGQKTGRNGRK